METIIRRLTSAAHLTNFWEGLRTSFWFLPTAMVIVAGALSVVLIAIDSLSDAEAVRQVNLFYSFGPEGARAVLSAIASSMITVAGITFSITVLTLQLASSQYGPRLLRNFMRDRGNQIVLGTFISTFVYCLLVLRTVRGPGDSFVPHYSVAFGVVLALASLAVLIYFFHHVASSIRIETLLAQLADDVAQAIDSLYPEQLGQAPKTDASPGTRVPDDFDLRSCRIAALEGGYVQVIEDAALMRITTQKDLIVRVDARPGVFVTGGESSLLSAYPAERVDNETADELRDAVIVGPERTTQQDVEFTIRILVEVAQRSLSPGINDPTTALYCIHRLREGFTRLSQRDIPAATRLDDEKNLRVVAEPNTLIGLACPAFAAIGRYAMKDGDVVRSLINAIGALAHSVQSNADRRKLIDLAEQIRREGEAQLGTAYDRELAATAEPSGSGLAVSRSPASVDSERAQSSR